ncbi:MAG: hypothetical protein ACRBN8_30965 [Nannocystales bacterium]
MGADDVYAEVDVSNLPLVGVHVVGPITDRGFDDYLDSLLAALQLRERVLLRLHAGPLTAYPPRYVRKSVAWMKRHEPILTRHVVAVSVVVESPAVRLATQAMMWAARPSFSTVAKQTSAEADDWLFARLQEDAR